MIIKGDISSRFNDTYFNNQSLFSEQLIINFESTFEEELSGNRHLPYQKYSDFYDNLFDVFEKNEKDKIIYNFKDELVY